MKEPLNALLERPKRTRRGRLLQKKFVKIAGMPAGSEMLREKKKRIREREPAVFASCACRGSRPAAASKRTARKRRAVPEEKLMALFESPISEYDRYFARGSDKVCFAGEKHPGRMLKLAPKAQAKPMLREIRCVEWLAKRGVKPSFMPVYYGRVETDEYAGFIQEMVSGMTLKRWLEEYWGQEASRFLKRTLRPFTERCSTSTWSFADSTSKTSWSTQRR